jgi:uncharacterized surface protein with fasciclin (FAS1) repeats
MLAYIGCEDPDFEETTNYEVLIGEYFEQNPDSFSMFVDVLNRSNTIAFLKAYGNYTCIAPTNSAIESYLDENGMTSLDDITDQEWKDLVRFSVINDTISSEMFVDGRMEYPTLQGQYLTTGTYIENGEIVTKINKIAPIIQKDIRVTNGIIHVVSKVLEPDQRSVVDYLKDLDGYSYFNKALEVTGLDTVLNKLPSAEDSDTTWYTIFAISDQNYQDEGIFSFEDLETEYGSDKDASGFDSLYYYMAYHVLPDQICFVSDLISAKVVSTLAPTEVLTVKSDGESVLINDDTFAGIYEPGFEINREVSDQTVGNGVIHFMYADFSIKVRYPFAVYWEVTAQTEIMKMAGVYGYLYQWLEYGQLENITWEPESEGIAYDYGGGNSYGYTVLNDIFSIYLRPEVVSSVTFTTPTLVKGTYKIWICTRNVPTSSRMPKFYVYFNGEQTTQIIDCGEAPSSIGSDEDGNLYPSDGELNLSGYKIYSYKPSDWYSTDSTTLEERIAEGIRYNWMGGTGWGRMSSQYAGTVIVTETGTQTLRFEAISGGASSYLWLDQIHFIPESEDQNWPRINVNDGSYVYLEDLLNGNFPEP